MEKEEKIIKSYKKTMHQFWFLHFLSFSFAYFEIRLLLILKYVCVILEYLMIENVEFYLNIGSSLTKDV